MGRPRKYTKKSLAAAVERYFLSISRTVPVTEKKATGEYDGMGHMIYADVPVKNDLGEQAYAVDYIQPPTVGGLCEYLGIHRSTWAEYCDADRYPEFADTTTRARGRLRAYLEQQLLIRKDVKGIIFDLQNNYGYADKRQVELGERASRAMSAANMPMDEKKALLEEIAREFGGGEDDAQPG